MSGTSTQAPAVRDVTDAGPERRPVADVGALAVLGGVLLWLPAAQGGRTTPEVLGLGLLVVLAAPAAYHALARTARIERWLLAALGLALLVHPFVAPYRDDLPGALLRYATVPLVYLVTRYTVQRWPRLLPIAFPIAGLWIWAQGWFGWLDPPETVFAAWRAVPWHNPSGILMGGLLTYAVTTLLAGRDRWLHAALAAVTASGLWLSASRASIAMTVLALLVVLGLHLRHRSQIAWLGGVAAVASLLTLVLLALSPAYGSGGSGVAENRAERVTGLDDPFSARGDASSNARARLLHVEAALRMFGDEPVTGVGLGSYAHRILDVAEPRMNYTRSAHSEPVEVLGEGGLLVGVPFALLTVAVAAGATVLVLRRRTTPRRSAAAACVGLMLAHTLFDVDWAYLAVVGTAAVAAGIAFTDPRPTTGSLPSASRLACLAVVVSLLLPVVLGATLLVERSVADAQGRAGWWEADPHVDDATRALAAGDPGAARRSTQRARAAAPGDPDLVALFEVVRLAERGDIERLHDLATRRSTPLRTVRFAVAALVGLDAALAQGAVEVLAPRLSTYDAERVEELVGQLEDLVGEDQLSSAL